MSKTYAARPALSTPGRGANSRGRGQSVNTNSPVRGRGTSTARGRLNPGGTAGNTQRRGGVTPARTMDNTRGGRNVYQAGRFQDPARQNDGIADEYQNTNQATSPPSIQTRTEVRDSYTVIKPDEKKRNAIQQRAKKEEESYEAYKESKKLSYVSCSGTVGGGQVNQTDVRQRTQQQHNRTPIERRQRSQQYRADEKARQDQEYNKKKVEQRRKTEQNDEREGNRTENMREEHRRQNNMFLDRIEQQNRAAHSKKVLSSTAAKSLSTQGNSDDESRVTNPSFVDPAPEVTTHQSQGGSTTQWTQDADVYNWRDPEPLPGSSAADPLTQLIHLYPNYKPEVLSDLLHNCQGDIQQAIDLLE